MKLIKKIAKGFLSLIMLVQGLFMLYIGIKLICANIFFIFHSIIIFPISILMIWCSYSIWFDK